MQAVILQDTSTVYSRALGKPDLTRDAVCASPLQEFMQETFPVRCLCSTAWRHKRLSFPARLHDKGRTA